MTESIIAKPWQRPISVWAIAIGLLALNLFLKLFWYVDVSLWLDEAFTIFEAQKSIGEIIADCKVDQNPPLYLILMHYWMGVFGISEFSVRGFSVLFSSLTPLVLFLGMRKQIGFNVALFASLLFTFSNVHFFYANEARTFALVSFLCAVSYSIFFNGFSKGSYLTYVLLGVVNVVAIYCHYIAVFIPFTQFFTSLFFLKGGGNFFKGVVLANLIILLSLVPWLGYVIAAMPEKGVYWLHPPGIRQLAGLFISFSGSKIFLGLFALVAGAWLFHHRSTLLQFFKWERNEKFVLLTLLSWAFVPVVIDYMVSFKTPIFLDRYLLYSSLGFYLLLGYFLFNLPGKDIYKLSTGLVLVVLFVATLKTNITKDEDWRGAVKYLKEQRTAGDLVIGSAWYTNMIFSYYYDKETFKQYSKIPDLLRDKRIQFANGLRADELAGFEPGMKIYLILGHSEDVDPEGTILKTVEANYDKLSESSFEKVRVLEYGRRE